MRTRTIAFLLLLLLLSPVTALAQLTFSTPTRISTNTGAHAPVLHVGRDGTIFASWFERNADIYFAHSTDGGKSFSVPVRASKQVTTNAYTSQLQRAPEFVIDTKGRIHLVWTEGRTGNQSDVWYIRSTDQGMTWTVPTSIMDADDSMKYAQDFSAIACDSSDNLYVSYLDNRWLMRRAASGHYQMHMQRSMDGGTTWSNPVIANKLSVISSGTCECCRQDIAVSPEGHVYIAFRTSQELSSTLDDRSIFICRSWDQGNTWDNSIRCQTETWNLTACPTKGPHISLNKQENLLLSWNDSRDDTGWVAAYFAMLPKGDNLILPNGRMSTQSQGGNWPSVSMSANGEIGYVFMPSGGQAQFTYSSDGGNTWNRDRAMPGRSGDDQTLPGIEFDAAGRALVVYQDADSDAILLTSIGGLNAATKLTPVKSLIPSSLPASQNITLRWNRPAGFGSGAYVWYTISVNQLTYSSLPVRDTQIVVPAPPTGSYNYTITAHSAFDSVTTSGSFTIADMGVRAASASKANLYPNPLNSGVLAFTTEGLQGLVTVNILNVVGITVKTLDVFAVDQTVRIDARNLPAGTYRAQLSNVRANWTLPFVIR